MNELLFTGMDIVAEVNKLLSRVKKSVCDGMTGDQELAYDMGIKNTLSALQGLLEFDEEPVVHISGLKVIEEMDIAELEERFLN